MNAFAANTFKWINKHGEQVFVRYRMLTDQSVRNLTPEQATRLAGSTPDYSTQDLVEAIGRGDFPSWTMWVQTMTLEQAEATPFNPFDSTKLWPEKDFPWKEVGRLTLNKVVNSHWDETEQSVFNPGTPPPDAQSHRMGANRNQLPINRPLVPVANYQREGAAVFVSQSGPHYFPNSFGGPAEDERAESLVRGY